MSGKIDTESAQEAYELVRNDTTPETWALLKYTDNKEIVLHRTGTDYDDMLSEFGEEERLYGYVRLEVGDELSKRAKFVLITYIGQNVSPLKKAAVSTDKAFVKMVFSQFQVEILADTLADVSKDKVEDRVRKAGGANYGTGVRD